MNLLLLKVNLLLLKIKFIKHSATIFLRKNFCKINIILKFEFLFVTMHVEILLTINKTYQPGQNSSKSEFGDPNAISNPD